MAKVVFAARITLADQREDRSLFDADIWPNRILAGRLRFFVQETIVEAIVDQ